jgi:hypothetical protein
MENFVRFVFGMLVFNCLVLVGYGQVERDSLILLNGRVYRGEIKTISTDFISLESLDKKGNPITSIFEPYRVFSYTQTGIEKIMYEQDDFKDNFLTVNEARNATLGSYDARQTFKPRTVFISSFVLGLGASLFDTYLPESAVLDPDYIGEQTSGGMFKKGPTIFPFIVPVVLTVSWSFPSFKVKSNQILQEELKNNEDYYRGYHRVAKQKRVLAALKGSVLGIGTGMIAYGILK